MVAESTHCSSLPNQQQYTHGRPPHEIGAAEGRDLSSAVSLPAAVLGSRRSSRVGDCFVTAMCRVLPLARRSVVAQSTSTANIASDKRCDDRSS